MRHKRFSDFEEFLICGAAAEILPEGSTID